MLTPVLTSGAASSSYQACMCEHLLYDQGTAYVVPLHAWYVCDTAVYHLPGTRSATRQRLGPVAVWTRPTPDKNEDWTRPSYIPTPGQSPVVQPYRRDDQPLYTPSTPEFIPAERPEQAPEMPKGPNMPGQCHKVLSACNITSYKLACSCSTVPYSSEYSPASLRSFWAAFRSLTGLQACMC